MAQNEHQLAINVRDDNGLDLVTQFLSLYRYGGL